LLIQRESHNPKLAFLVNHTLPESTYYRWKIHSLRQGNTMRVWKTDPFQLIPGGSVWIPPPCEHSKPVVARRVDPTASAVASTTSSASSSNGGSTSGRPSGALNPDLAEEFESMLRTITIDRRLISDAMVFAISHANCAHDVVEISVDSLVLSETPIPRKLARLFFISDVLYNSTAPVANASTYRTK
jgi:U2-associated protein SR140